MASTYTEIGTELMTTGENAGNWGTKTNTNIQILEEALRGYVSQSLNTAGAGANTTALTYTDGSTGDAARNMVIALTGSITGNKVVTVTAKEKMWIVDNQTSGAYTVQFMVSGQTGVTWATTDKGTKILYCNGTDVIDTDIGGVGSYDLNGEELILDADADTSFTADTDDQIDIKIGGTDQLTIKDGALSPVTTNDIDLGTASLEFKDAYFDGTVTSDAFAGPLTGNVTGNASGTAATVTTAAQSNITSLGTLTTLTVDNVITNGATIGHTSDTDLITLADGIVTVAGEISVTTLDIGGTNVTSDATELNLLDGKDATYLATPTKFGGTNFSNGILIGNTTTGTLDGCLNALGIGPDALESITTGDSDIAIGLLSLPDLTTGSGNVCVGVQTGTAITTQWSNTLIGNQAGKISTGTGNICLGNEAGEALSSGSGNIIIGNGIDVATATGDRQLVIAGNDESTTTTWISGDSSGNLTFKRVDTGDDNPYVLTLQTGETDIASADVLGSINFQAPDEGAGTDAILVAAGIDAVSEGDFSSSNNATKLSFKTAASEAAAEKMSLSSAGVLTVSSTITANSQDVILGKNGGTNFTSSLLVGHATTGTLDAAQYNTGVGDAALNSITSGDNNTAIGYNSLTAINTGTQNVGLGGWSLSAATNDTGNTAVGYLSQKDATGQYNTSLGYDSLEDVTGSYNIGIGNTAGKNITTGSGNVIIGDVDAPSAR